MSLPRFVTASLSVIALSSLGVLAIGGSASAVAGPPAYYPSGPQLNVDKSALEGWTLCYSGDMGATAPLYGDGGILSELCTGEYLLVAGGLTGGPVLSLLAAAPLVDATFDTGNNLGKTHPANGSTWYFYGGRSWGFALGGDLVSKNSCDTLDLNPEYRLCFHAAAPGVDDDDDDDDVNVAAADDVNVQLAAAAPLDGAELQNGYRLGALTGLGPSSGYSRYIYQASSREIPEAAPAVVPTLPDTGIDASVPFGLAGGLLVAGLVAFGFVRRRAAQ